MLSEKDKDVFNKHITLVTNENNSKEVLTLSKDSILYDDDLYIGYIKYTTLNKDTIYRLKQQYGDEFEDYFMDILDILDDEYNLIFKKLKSDSEFVYLNKIDIGFHKGSGMGDVALRKFIAKFKNKKIILYSYPIPLRFQLGFDDNYMNEALEKLNSFYSRVGFKQINNTHLFELN